MKLKDRSAMSNALLCPFLLCAVGIVSVRAGGLALDAAGNIFEPRAHSILKFTPDGTKSTFATGLENPLRPTFDGGGNLFVSDTGIEKIFEFAPDGKKKTFATDINAVGLAFDSAGNLFVSSVDSIFKFTPQGVKSEFASGLDNPLDIAFDGAGNLFVAEMGAGHSILKFRSDGTKATFATGLQRPIGLAADPAGNLYVTDRSATDASSHAILKFAPDGTKTTFASNVGGDAFSSLAVDLSGNVFASSDRVIVKFAPNGTSGTVASEGWSPDKKWEYKCAEYAPYQCTPEILKAGSEDVELDLDEDDRVHSPEASQAEVVWEPDSKRFAFNYSPPHASHTTYKTTALYQLRGDKWVPLQSPVNEESERSQLAQLAKTYLPKNTYKRRFLNSQSVWDILTVREWADGNTAILYAYAGNDDGEGAALFTLKFDAEGKGKIVKAKQLSKKEVEQLQ